MTRTDRIRLTVFTDPMMGLTYEMEPLYDRLRSEFGGRIEYRWVMSLLVRDVSDFMTPEERAMEPEAGILRYNARLADIYRSEEAVGGLPLRMEGFRLFDAAHRSSKPLNLAYKAAQLADPERADAFLRLLRRATVLDCRPTTHFEEILRVVREAGIDEARFRACWADGAEAALNADLALTRLCGVRALPAHLLQRGDRALMLRSFDYADFADAIRALEAI